MQFGESGRRSVDDSVMMSFDSYNSLWLLIVIIVITTILCLGSVGVKLEEVGASEVLYGVTAGAMCDRTPLRRSRDSARRN